MTHITGNKIMILGKFSNIYDEEYIARSFETIGCSVMRVDSTKSLDDVADLVFTSKPIAVLYFKLNNPGNVKEFMQKMKYYNIITICWVFDLYFGYPREYKLNSPQFKADYVFSTDAGHDKEFKQKGINHHVIRQGIYDKECYMLPTKYEYDVVFVGSDSPIYPKRTAIMDEVAKDFNFKWFGKNDTNEVRSTKLNELFSKSKIVIGDSFPSDYYWSNRIVETLGRGGFMMHRYVKGIEKVYPDLVTYDGTYRDLKAKIQYYLEHEEEREAIRQKNFFLVKNSYTMDKACKYLLDYVKI